MIFWILVAILGLLGGCDAPSNTPRGERNAPTQANRPMSSPKPRIAYPKPDSAGQIFYLTHYYSPQALDTLKKTALTRWRAALKREFGIDFQVNHSYKYFHIAYRGNDAQAEALGYVARVFFQSVYPRYFLYEPAAPFQIVYFANQAEFRRYTKSAAYGFYRPGPKTLYTYIGSGEGTLWHELIHAFIDDHIHHSIQQWFNEGFASFYEMGAITNNTFIEGYTNWRQPLLHDMLRRPDNLSLRTFVAEQVMSEDNAYAKARFLFCYLWMKGKMSDFVKAYLYELSPQHQGKALAAQSMAKIEQLLGKSWTEIEQEYTKRAFQLGKYQKLTQE